MVHVGVSWAQKDQKALCNNESQLFSPIAKDIIDQSVANINQAILSWAIPLHHSLRELKGLLREKPVPYAKTFEPVVVCLATFRGSGFKNTLKIRPRIGPICFPFNRWMVPIASTMHGKRLNIHEFEQMIHPHLRTWEAARNSTSLQSHHFGYGKKLQ